MRLIDADSANVDDIPCYYGSNCHVEDVEEWLKDQPTIDAVPVVHGRWIEKVGRAECSVCHDECWADSAMEYNYCPNCGAKMGGEADVQGTN